MTYEVQKQNSFTKKWEPLYQTEAPSRRQAVKKMGYKQQPGTQTRVVKI